MSSRGGQSWQCLIAIEPLQRTALGEPNCPPDERDAANDNREFSQSADHTSSRGRGEGQIFSSSISRFTRCRFAAIAINAASPRPAILSAQRETIISGEKRKKRNVHTSTCLFKDNDAIRRYQTFPARPASRLAPRDASAVCKSTFFFLSQSSQVFFFFFFFFRSFSIVEHAAGFVPSSFLPILREDFSRGVRRVGDILR